MSRPLTEISVPKLNATVTAVVTSHHSAIRSQRISSQPQISAHTTISGQPRKPVFSAGLAGKCSLATMSAGVA